MASDKDKGMEPSSDNDQLVRTVPGTDIGGHDTAGVDGEKRTERSGDLLGTPNSEPSESTVKNREQSIEQSDFVAQEVDRANREDLPRLGGDTGPGNWKPEKGGPPEFLTEGEKPASSRTSAAPGANALRTTVTDRK